MPLEKNVKSIERFYRPYEIIPEPGLCLLEQGIVCVGPAPDLDVVLSVLK